MFLCPIVLGFTLHFDNSKDIMLKLKAQLTCVQNLIPTMTDVLFVALEKSYHGNYLSCTCT